jgi:dihydropyrimidine dehydrogenase (NAD+) subunit PreT
VIGGLGAAVQQIGGLEVSSATCGSDFEFPGAFSLSQATAEAERCLLCLDAPCSKACPAGTDPGAFVRKLRLKNLTGAVRTIKVNNILGGICGVTCPTERLCEKECSACGIDRAVRIGALQRFLVEYGWQVGFRPLSAKPANGVRVAVVGSGPAGLGCAASLAREGFDVTVFEARPKPGGILRYGVPPFRLSESLLDREVADVAALGVRIECDAPVTGPLDGLLRQGFSAAFLAAGLASPYKLGLPGMDFAGVFASADFLREARSAGGGGAAVVRGRNVAVVGGGSVAMDVATTCKAFGARRVYCIALESMEELPASHEDLHHAIDRHVIVRPQSRVKEVLGAGGAVSGVHGCETEWIVPGLLVPSNAKDVEGSDFSLPVGAVVLAIGSGPDPRLREALPGARFTARGLVEVDPETMATAVAGVFAGGDVVRGPGTVVEAVADGKKAAKGIAAFCAAASR